MEHNYQDLMTKAKEDIRDLKTAGKYPATSVFGNTSFSPALITETDARAIYRINYEQETDGLENIEPITMLMSIPTTGIYLKPYNANTQTQELWVDYNQSVYGNLTIVSTRAITSVSRVQ